MPARGRRRRVEVRLDPRLEPAGPTRAPAAPRGAGSRRLRAGSRLYRGPGLPPDIARSRTAEAFLPAEPILWVRRAGSGMRLPYTFTPEVARVVGQLLRGRRDAASLPPPDVLHAVGAAGGPRDVTREQAGWRRQVRDWRRGLRTSGYAVLRDLFPSIFIAAVRTYYRRLERGGYLRGGDARRRGGPLIHDEPLLVFLGAQLAAVVRQVTRERVRSTFSFLRVYGGGAVLARHRDRPACRWNIDLVVGGDPVPRRGTAWPLRIAARSGRRAVRLGLGDGVLYRGTHLTHWRSAQPAGQSTVLACFHYGRGRSRD